MSDYKKDFYQKYESTHLNVREEKMSQSYFVKRKKMMINMYQQYFPKNKNSMILDLGCGYGEMTGALQDQNYVNVSGCDVGEDQIKKGKELGVKNIFISEINDFVTDKNEYGKYDFIILRDVLEHFKKVDGLDLISNIFNLLKENGELFIQVPNASSPLFGNVRYGDFTHDIAYTQGSLNQLLRVCGFKSINFYPYHSLSGSPKYHPKNIIRKSMSVFINFVFKIIYFLDQNNFKIITTFNIIALAKK